MLGFRLLNNVSSVNSFEIVDEFSLHGRNTTEIYFMVYQDLGVRYIPKSDATVEVLFDHIDSSKKINRLASQPYMTDDRSICKVFLMPTDKIASGSMRVFLTENGIKKELKALSDLLITATDMKRFVC